jgi:pyruvate dehydrogenase complex dehydrogenase (E1) component
MTFVYTLDDSTSYRATVLRKIQDRDTETHAKIKFLVELGDGEFDEIVAYSALCECIYYLEDDKVSPEEKA